MSDLVERLRIRAEASDFDAGIFEEAADEIERLTAESEARRLWLSVHGLTSVDALLDERDRLRDERLRSATEIMALRHLLDQFKKRLSDRTAEAMRLHKIIADAPHDGECIGYGANAIYYPDECDCWKREVE